MTRAVKSGRRFDLATRTRRWRSFSETIPLSTARCAGLSELANCFADKHLTQIIGVFIRAGSEWHALCNINGNRVHTVFAQNSAKFPPSSGYALGRIDMNWFNRRVVRLSRRRRGVATMEWILLFTLLVIGVIGGLGAVRFAILSELQDIAQAISNLNFP